MSSQGELLDQTGKQGRMYFAFQADLLFIGVWSVPFGESGFALPVLYQDERQDHDARRFRLDCDSWTVSKVNRDQCR